MIRLAHDQSSGWYMKSAERLIVSRKDTRKGRCAFTLNGRVKYLS